MTWRGEMRDSEICSSRHDDDHRHFALVVAQFDVTIIIKKSHERTEIRIQSAPPLLSGPEVDPLRRVLDPIVQADNGYRFTFPIPIPASHDLVLPQLDMDDGFVHTSSAAQTADTLRLFFKDIEGVWILKINAERLGKWRKIDWVQGSGSETTEKG